MARQKMLAEQAGAIAAPRQMISPWQGAAQLGQSFVNNLKQSRNDEQLKAGRAALAQIMSGIDPASGATSAQTGEAYQIDPDLGLKLMDQAIQARRENAAQQLHASERTQDRQWAVTDADRAAQAATAGREDQQAFTHGEGELNRQTEIDKANAAAKAALVPKISDISGVRQDVIGDPSYKNMAQAVPIWSSMQDAATRDTPQADLNMVVGLAKLLDPTSVVRQSESGAVELTGNLPAQLTGQYKYLTATPGSRLPPEVRQGLLQEAWSRVKGYQDAYNQTGDWYGNLASESGIPTDKVVPSFGEIKPYVAPGTPPPNTMGAPAGGPGGPPVSSAPGAAPAPPPGGAGEALPNDTRLIKPGVSYAFPNGKQGVWSGTGDAGDPANWKMGAP
jgi:hypothetical protein